MESASSLEPPPEPHSSPFAKAIGFAIALLTLTLPLVIIAHFSSVPAIVPPVSPVPLSSSRN
jgi:hypothetical protein